jgi:hypothetical protein
VLVEPGDFRTQITAKRCVAEASQNSAYRTAFDKFKRKQDQDEAAEPTPEPVARLAVRLECSAARRRRGTCTDWRSG